MKIKNLFIGVFRLFMLIIYGVCFVPCFIIGRVCAGLFDGFFNGFVWTLPITKRWQ